MIYLSLIQNIALLTALTFVHSLMFRRLKRGRFFYPLLSGLLFGFVCVIGTAGLGVVWHYLRRRQQWVMGTTALFIFGLLVHILMLTALLTTLPEPAAQIWPSTCLRNHNSPERYSTTAHVQSAPGR